MPVAPVTEDTEAKAFAPPPGKAGVYIARNSILAYGVLFQIIVDGKMVGGIAKDTYHWLTVEPGEHSVVVMSRENQDMVEFTAEEGQNYFYIVELTKAESIEYLFCRRKNFMFVIFGFNKFDEILKVFFF